MIERKREILGRNIQRYRLFKGIDGKTLGDKVGLTKETISKVETGKEKNLGLDYLLKICEELGVTPEELFIEDSNLLSLRFVISEHNIKTLRQVIDIIRDIVERKK